MRDVLNKNMVEVYLFGKYVDDVNAATSIIRKGCKWVETKDG